MIDPKQDAKVITLIEAEARRPRLTSVLWSQVKALADASDGTFLAGLGELAEMLGSHKQHVSQALLELVSFGAVEKIEAGLWRVSPRVMALPSEFGRGPEIRRRDRGVGRGRAAA